ncbi:MAG: PTS glucitol/sorbitol transporter subunit IIA [Anaerostipes sp.]|nr:PTS glucitol/sorbitol transporter subunit IIA [Anaerostipes sp.]
MKYCSKITGHGAEAFSFLGDPDTNMIIIFNEGAPPILEELSVLHEVAELKEGLAVGDTISFGDAIFKISALGSEVNKTLGDLGHCTIDLNGGDEPERPGCLAIEGERELTQDDLKAGNLIQIY